VPNANSPDILRFFRKDAMPHAKKNESKPKKEYFFATRVKGLASPAFYPSKGITAFTART
jgi:hypothetical protein